MSAPLTLRSVGASVYLPAVLFGIGQGTIAPVLALSARDLHASLAMASVVVALLGVGRIAGDLPAGMLAVRIGERRTMLVAAAVAACGLVVCIVARTVPVLGAGVACVGVATAAWSLARHAYLTDVMPLHLRARALSTLGGTQRIGLFVGPLLGAAVMGPLGTNGGYWVFLACAVAAAAALIALPDVPQATTVPRAVRSRAGTLHGMVEHLPVLRTLGVAVLLVGAVRASRQVAVPLWAEHVGLDPAATSLVFAVSGAVDMLLFYPAGLAMDRIGRRWVVVPSMLLLGLAHVLLPLTQGVATLTAAAMLMGLGNGMGSGINMTIGADVSPAVSRVAFLGAWRLCGDIGNGVGPLALSAITALTALGPAVAAMGAVAGVSAIAMARWIPRFVVPAPSAGGRAGN